MELRDFRGLIERLAADVPAHYRDGIVAVEVSPRTVAHPVYPSVYTMGECIPIDAAGDPPPSRVVLYHGSFRALASERADFDWRAEAWDTLTHELRHHLEWRANARELDLYDWAAEQNFRRLEGEAFDPVFYLSGERVAEDLYCVDDDLFWDREVARAAPSSVEIDWQGRRYRADVPKRSLPLYVALDGLEPPPVGEAIVALRLKPRVWDLFRPHRRPVVEHADVCRAD